MDIGKFLKQGFRVPYKLGPIVVAAFLVLLAPTGAQAEGDIRIAGASNVKSWCEEPEGSDFKLTSDATCDFYIRAVFERLWLRAAMANIANSAKHPNPVTCFPSYLNNRNVLDIVRRKLKGSKADGFAAVAVEDAIIEAWPDCFGGLGIREEFARSE